MLDNKKTTFFWELGKDSSWNSFYKFPFSMRAHIQFLNIYQDKDVSVESVLSSETDMLYEKKDIGKKLIIQSPCISLDY